MTESGLRDIRIEVSARGFGGTSGEELEEISRWERKLFSEDKSVIDAYCWHDGSGQGFNIQAYYEGLFVGFANVFARLARADDCAVLMGALCGVMTRKEYQGMGIGKAVVETGNRVISRSLRADLGILLCTTPLVAFYETSGWRRFPGRVSVEQPTGSMMWSQEAMILTKAEDTAHPICLDLCGYPF